MHAANTESLFRCDASLSDRENKLRDLAQCYVTRCEAYDRTVCTGPIKHGEIIPIGGHETGLVNRNANRVLDQILMDNPGFTRSEILRASARLSP